MVESMLSKVKVNREIPLCETYDIDTKELIKRVFYKKGISFYIKFKRNYGIHEEIRYMDKNSDKKHYEYHYIFHVNALQKNEAKAAIAEAIADEHDTIFYYDETNPDDVKKKGLLSFLLC